MDVIFTDHAKKRIKKRKIKEEEVIKVIENPQKSYKSEGKYYSQGDLGRGKIEVVFEKDKYINVITVYWIQ